MREEYMEQVMYSLKKLEAQLEEIEGAAHRLYLTSEEATEARGFSEEEKRMMCELNELARSIRKNIENKNEELQYYRRKLHNILMM